jgi:hypothetical protein
MEEEYDALITNNTWDLVPHPVGSNVITGKWIFKHKFNSDSTLERHKAHCVLHGFTQPPGIDYDDTFSLVIKPTTVRTVLSLVVSRSYPVHQLDVKNTFLHGTLLEIVYCSESTGFVDPTQPDQVYRLNKSLYGLKKAPRLGTAGLPRTSSLWDLLRPTPTPSYSSSAMMPMRYTCCFMLMTLCSPYLAQRSCSTPYLPSSGNSP